MSAARQAHAPQKRRANTISGYSQVVERVIGTMRAHLSEPLALEEMAEIACLSPFHFHRVFRSVTGIPPSAFLGALRLEAAKRLLLTTSLRVTDVCFELGYASLGTFTTRFTHLIGVSPMQIRQLAERVEPSFLGSAVSDARGTRRAATAHATGVSGAVTVPSSFSGLIFAGLFPFSIPQGHPVACVTLAAPGSYQMSAVPDGRYYLLGVALPQAQSALPYLLPGAGLLVGVGERPALVGDGRASAPVNLALRPLRAADPPILGVFPPLLAAATALPARVAV
jgi:AraC-like DNA-binding protein